MAPITIDPPVLAGAGKSTASAGDELASAVGTLTSALAGSGAAVGSDLAGLAFSTTYQQCGQNLLNALATAVGACRNLGFGIEMAAVNHSRADAASTVGGGRQALAAPGAPDAFDAPRVPAPTGPRVPAPALWEVVETFVDGTWPDGNPATLRAAAEAWRAMASAVDAVGMQLSGPKTMIEGQRIDEGPSMTDSLTKAGTGLSALAGQCNELAMQIDGFAGEVAAAQGAIRDLLHRLTNVSSLFVQLLKGEAGSEIRQIAEDIKAILHNLKREVDGAKTVVHQAMDALDAAVVEFEKFMRQEFTHYLGENVGNKVATVFDTELNIGEGTLTEVVSLGEGMFQLVDPTDPQGAKQAWKRLGELALRTNPLTGPMIFAADPQGSIAKATELGKGLVHAEDWSRDRPGLGFGKNVVDVAGVFVPGAGEAGAAARAGELGAATGRVGGVEAGAAGRAVTRAGETLGRAAPVGERAGQIGADLGKIETDFSKGAQAGPNVGGGSPAPIGEHAPPTVHETPQGRVAEPAPIGEHASPTAPAAGRESAPVGTTPEPHPASGPGGFPGEHAPVAAAPESGVPPAPVSPEVHPSEPSATHTPVPPPAETPATLARDVHPFESAPEGSPADGTVSEPPFHDGGGGDDGGGNRSGTDHGIEDFGGDKAGPGGDEGLTAEKRDEILAIEKGDRPDPSDYLTPEFIESHLDKFSDGAARFMPEGNFDKYGIAQRDGTSFVMPRSEADALIEATQGDSRAMEKALGLPEGFLDSERMVRIDVERPMDYNLRVPSGNEAGANDQWIPGGVLPDGASEAIIDGGSVAPDGYRVARIP